MLGDKLAGVTSQSVIIENRAGAAGGIAAQSVAKSPADGYTLLFGTTGTQTMNPAINSKLPYDSLKDFASVSNFAASPFVLVINPNIPAQNLKELIDLANKKPGALRYASFGTGSSAHMTGEMFKLRAGVDITHVPYKGAGPALIDVIGGHVDMMFTLAPSVVQHLRSGSLRTARDAAELMRPVMAIPGPINAPTSEGCHRLIGERAAETTGLLTAVSLLAEKTGAKLAWVPRRAGERGAIESGAIGTLLPGGRPVEDAAARVDIATVWGVPSLPANVGRTTSEIIDSLGNGSLDAVVVGGVDPQDMPNSAAALAALSKSFVVSLEIAHSAVTNVADVVLPVAAVTEKSGSFLNWEGRARA
ncbi:MAG: hypothetical protein EBQ98_05005, partial [Actinobacteria bacterium]|nr:hypothetical protein [Actinomycetota bacterium]